MMIAEPGLSFTESKVFFETHVGSWLGDFFADLERAEAARFYRAVGRLGRGFIAIEQTYYAMPT